MSYQTIQYGSMVFLPKLHLSTHPNKTFTFIRIIILLHKITRYTSKFYKRISWLVMLPHFHLVFMLIFNNPICFMKPRDSTSVITCRYKSNERFYWFYDCCEYRSSKFKRLGCYLLKMRVEIDNKNNNICNLFSIWCYDNFFALCHHYFDIFEWFLLLTTKVKIKFLIPLTQIKAWKGSFQKLQIT